MGIVRERVVARVDIVNLGRPWPVPASLSLVACRFLDGCVPHGRFVMRTTVGDAAFMRQLTELQTFARSSSVKVTFRYDRLEDY